MPAVRRAVRAMSRVINRRRTMLPAPQPGLNRTFLGLGRGGASLGVFPLFLRELVDGFTDMIHRNIQAHQRFGNADEKQSVRRQMFDQVVRNAFDFGTGKIDKDIAHKNDVIGLANLQTIQLKQVDDLEFTVLTDFAFDPRKVSNLAGPAAPVVGALSQGNPVQFIVTIDTIAGDAHGFLIHVAECDLIGQA